MYVSSYRVVICQHLNFKTLFLAPINIKDLRMGIGWEGGRVGSGGRLYHIGTEKHPLCVY